MKVASIATYSERLDVLPDAVRSLAPQVNIIHVYYNGLPTLTNQVKIFQLLSEYDDYEQKVKIQFVDNQADLSKFRAIWDYPDATIFTCDDDLIYSDEYVYRMDKCLNQDPMIGADVVTLGGKQFKQTSIEHETRFRNLFHNRSSCFGRNTKWDDTPTYDIPLSGVSAFKASLFQDCEIDERFMYAADLQMAKWCADKELVIKSTWNRPRPLVEYNKKMKGKETIWDNHTSKSPKIVELAKEIWRSQK